MTPPPFKPKAGMGLSGGWNYEHYPNAGHIVSARCIDILQDLKTSPSSFREQAFDSRPFHKRLFSGLTPSTMLAFAGHYRGEAFPYLQTYSVQVDGDRRVGLPPHLVTVFMQSFEIVTRQALADYEAAEAAAKGTPREALVLA